LRPQLRKSVQIRTLRFRLPRGLVTGAGYAETGVAAWQKRTLTFLSDAVEARNALGELFGFDRAPGHQSRAGEDDITNLALSRKVNRSVQGDAIFEHQWKWTAECASRIC
jgi:hypothetical protein